MGIAFIFKQIILYIIRTVRHRQKLYLLLAHSYNIRTAVCNKSEISTEKTRLSLTKVAISIFCFPFMIERIVDSATLVHFSVSKPTYNPHL